MFFTKIPPLDVLLSQPLSNFINTSFVVDGNAKHHIAQITILFEMMELSI